MQKIIVVYARKPATIYNDPSIESSYYDQVPIYQVVIERPDSVRRKRPIDLWNNMTYSSSSITSSRNTAPTINIYTQSGGYSTYEYPTPGLNWGTGFQPDTNSVVHKILASIKSQKVNLTVLVPELGKTTDMFMNLARSVYEGYRRLRRGEWIQGAIYDSRRMKKRDRELARKWLEYSYGWKPLMNDIYGLHQELQRDHASEFQYVKASGSFGRKQSTKSGRWTQIIVNYEHSVRLRARFRYLAQLHSRASVGLMNPLATAWELAPYSFVLDWAINVGDYLNNLDALVGVIDHSLYSTERVSKKVTGSYKQNTTQGSPGTGEDELVTLSRSIAAPISASPPPALNIHMGTERVASALALLRSLK